MHKGGIFIGMMRYWTNTSAYVAVKLVQMKKGNTF
jgi:hypothetical protein